MAWTTASSGPSRLEGVFLFMLSNRLNRDGKDESHPPESLKIKSYEKILYYNGVWCNEDVE